jgi:hypothetical protein
MRSFRFPWFSSVTAVGNKNLRQPAIHGLQTRAVPSLLPDTSAMPSVDQASVVTVPRCPSNSQVGPQFFLHFPTTTSQ